MKIKPQEDETKTGHCLVLKDGTQLWNEEIFDEEEKRGEEFVVKRKLHILYKSSLENPKGAWFYEEIEEQQ